MKRTKLVLYTLSLVLATCAGIGWKVSPVVASDHIDTPTIAADPAADFGDLYAWHNPGAGKFYVVVTFAGLAGVTADAPILDSRVLYEFHFDSNGDLSPDTTVEVRFGQNGQGDWGVQCLNLPGAAGPIVGPFGAILGGDARVFTGVTDDPFFFDAQGQAETLATGLFSYDNTRDFFQGRNVVGIALEMPISALNPSPDPATPIQVWATSGRIN